MSEQIIRKNNEVAKKEEKYLTVEEANNFRAQQLSVIKSVSTQDGHQLTATEIAYATPIVNNLIVKCVEGKVDINKLNLTTFIDQTVKLSKLGHSIENKELWIDIRNNGKTGQIDVVIKKQYQAIKKELIRYCSKKIVRFIDGVVYKGDEFEITKDFNTGIENVKKHIEKNTCSKEVSNIIGAYAIAYVEENNQLVPYAAIVDKERIKSAYASASTKNIWNSHPTAMALKTAYWVLANNKLQAYMKSDIDYESANDDFEFETHPQQEELTKSYDIDEDNVVDSVDESVFSVEEDIKEETTEEQPKEEVTQEMTKSTSKVEKPDLSSPFDF